MKFIKYSLGLLVSLCTLQSCFKDNSYPGGRISPYIGILDVRTLYMDKDVVLSQDNMDGSDSISAMVISDHSGKNIPGNLLFVQDNRRLSKLRGIAIDLGTDAANYAFGDSVNINLAGATLTKENHILVIKGVTKNDIRVISTGNIVASAKVRIDSILAFPDDYESTLGTIAKCSFDPIPTSSDVFSGNKTILDGYGSITLTTEDTATFAQQHLDNMATYTGLIGMENDTLPNFKLMTTDGIASLIMDLQPAVISGFASDIKGSDGNYEYVQCLATRDIDFSVTPYSLVVCNNAGASTPTGIPTNGWATGGMRSYKINITSGFAAKGTYFYIGGLYKLINGSASTDISSANWVANYDYVNNAGQGFGTKTGGLMANSGNAFGIALFNTTNVTAATVPVDVIFISGGGTLLGNGAGYRITTNDWYDIVNPITSEQQPFYKMGSNTNYLSYVTADIGNFYRLGGVYNTKLGRWTVARSQANSFTMDKSTPLSRIENDSASQLIQ